MEDSKQQADEKVAELDDVRVALTMDTKLGNSKADFLLTDLQRITYFKNQLSGRWNNDNTINISSNDLNCSVNELESLIFYKKCKKINPKYPHQRLPYFCNALDYFTEKIEQKIFEKYFCQCIPAIQYKQLITLKSLCDTKECSMLSAAIKQSIQQINDAKKKYHDKILNNWTEVSLKCLICNDYVAAAVFISKFKIASWDTFLHTRNASDLNKLWDYIVKQKVYLKYPQILKAIYDLKKGDDSYYYTVGKDLAESLINIAVNTIEIIFGNKDLCNDSNKKGIKQMIVNFLRLISSQEFKGHQAVLYALVKAIAVKLLELENKNICTFDSISGVFELTKIWFAGCAKKKEEWIITQTPMTHSAQVMQPLFDGICSYIASKEYTKNPCLPIYIDFVNKYTNINWNLK
eukprot:236755_1